MIIVDFELFALGSETKIGIIPERDRHLNISPYAVTGILSGDSFSQLHIPPSLACEVELSSEYLVVHEVVSENSVRLLVKGGPMIFTE